VGVNAPGLEGAWDERRALTEVTEERVPFLEIVSEPLGQVRFRGAAASSLVIKEVIRDQRQKRKNTSISTCFALLSLHTCTLQPSSLSPL
jgi:hypothetical protein